MKRLEFITLVGGAAAAWPLAVRAQQPATMKRVAMVHPSNKVDDLTKLTQQREITPCVWVHPDDER